MLASLDYPANYFLIFNRAARTGSEEPNGFPRGKRDVGSRTYESCFRFNRQAITKSRSWG